MVLAALFIVLILASAMDTPLRHALSDLLRRFGKLVPRTAGGKLALAAATLFALVLLFQLFKSEALGVAGPMAGELGVWFALIDIGSAMDLLAVTALAFFAIRFNSVGQTARALHRQVTRLWRRGARAIRRQRRRSTGKPSDEDEPWGLSFGAAMFA